MPRTITGAAEGCLGRSPVARWVSPTEKVAIPALPVHLKLLTVRFGSTTKIVAECMLNYYRR